MEEFKSVWLSFIICWMMLGESRRISSEFKKVLEDISKVRESLKLVKRIRDGLRK